MQYVTAELYPDEPHQPRRGERRSLCTAAQCRRGSNRETVELRDLSLAGARVVALAPLRAGFSVWLKLPGLEAIEARIVWTQGFESGCEFVRPLHPAVFDTLAR